MDWIGNGEHAAILAGALLAELLILTRHLATKHRRVPHRELRAFGARRGPAAGFNAPRNAPVAGTQTLELRAVGQSSDHARIGGAAVSTSSETPHPAPGLRIPLPGAGLKQPVTVTPPDVAVAGSPPHPRGEVVADAVRPRLTASATQPLDAGAVAQTAPATTSAA